MVIKFKKAKISAIHNIQYVILDEKGKDLSITLLAALKFSLKKALIPSRFYFLP